LIRKGAIAGCINAIIRQKYPDNQMEVIVVDDCSNDDTVALNQIHPVGVDVTKRDYTC